ncbi:MAG: hypothetical protein ACYTFQ_26770 [Planctomycetota bacterium]|jgi:hypothetical protein
MADVTVEIDVDCLECGETLKTDSYKGMILVTPCSKCLAEARREGYDEGYEDAEDV